MILNNRKQGCIVLDLGFIAIQKEILLRTAMYYTLTPDKPVRVIMQRSNVGIGTYTNSILAAAARLVPEDDFIAVLMAPFVPPFSDPSFSKTLAEQGVINKVFFDMEGGDTYPEFFSRTQAALQANAEDYRRVS